MTNRIVFFQGQSSNGTSSNILSSHYKDFAFYIHSSGIAGGGAQVAFQAQSPIGDWHDIDSRAITSGVKMVVKYQGAASQIRSVISGYISGGFNVSAEAY